ncbi:hypothetical protein GCM10008027_21790 [Pseudoalteromonas gelatinilytica]|uniref:Uncharacterized protein n=1 Tax=Pseudoalteromonas gelatinilytica TaxID=1703256 RepID=A0ABQ1TKA3_9GAMM|nr:hypothetical protein GCM10008027_21790 [Pseudoalteromonas profundi]
MAIVKIGRPKKKWPKLHSKGKPITNQNSMPRKKTGRAFDKQNTCKQINSKANTMEGHACPQR